MTTSCVVKRFLEEQIDLFNVILNDTQIPPGLFYLIA